MDLDEARRLADVFGVGPAAILSRPLTPEEDADLTAECPIVLVRMSGGGAASYATGASRARPPLGATERQLVTDLTAHAHGMLEKRHLDEECAEMLPRPARRTETTPCAPCGSAKRASDRHDLRSECGSVDSDAAAANATTCLADTASRFYPPILGCATMRSHFPRANRPRREGI